MDLQFDLGFARVRIAQRIQLDGFGQQNRALAVEVEAPAFIDDRRPQGLRPGQTRHFRIDQRVLAPFGPILLPPTVEVPQHRSQFTVCPANEAGPDVAHPSIVQRRSVNIDPGVEIVAGKLDVGRVDDHADRLEGQDRVRDGGPGAACGMRLVRRFAGVRSGRRKRHPDPLLRLGLGGHPPIRAGIRAHECAPERAGAGANNGE